MNKTIQSHALLSWKYWILGILTLPLGIGAVFLIAANSFYKRNQLIVHEDFLIWKQGNKKIRLELDDLRSAKKKFKMFWSKLGLFDVEISTSNQVFILQVVKRPEALVETLELIIEKFEVEREKMKPRPPAHDDLPIGGLDPYNDLIGFYHAGLISEEDFLSEEEKYHPKNS